LISSSRVIFMAVVALPIEVGMSGRADCRRTGTTADRRRFFCSSTLKALLSTVAVDVVLVHSSGRQRPDTSGPGSSCAP
jgi:hypothetical protein